MAGTVSYEGTNPFSQINEYADLQIAFRNNDGLVVFGAFQGAAPTIADLFTPGCILIKTDAAGGTSALFTNQGTSAAPSFVEL